MQDIIKDFISKNDRVLKIIALIFIIPVIACLSSIILQTLFTFGNYVGTFLRGVYDFFVCGA